ncbi:MAG: FAD-binding oxidoreductase [Vulcanisaeta sp.]|uniref:FAD-binding oxidoreductase n=1 Tax=Vulcanisaeta sp. TaxID=2020871 RepID=UPI003D09A31C
MVSMTQRQGDVIKELEAVFKDRLFTEPHILSLYSHDASSEVGVKPMAVIQPVSVDEVVKIVKLAIDYGFKIIPVGSSTSLSGNATPKLENTVIVSLERMNSIIEISDIDWYARVQPGIKDDELNLELMGYGLQWPVDPASSKTATVGGVISNGGGGMRGAKYGPASHWVLGLEAVIGTGDVIRVGCRTVKCREGYNLVQTFIGSEGTLGIITEATLRLAPLPESFVGLMARFRDAESLVNAVIRVKRDKLWPMVTEFIDYMIAQVLGLEPMYYLWIGIDTYSGSEQQILSKLNNDVSLSGGEIIDKAFTWQEFSKILEPRRMLYSATLKAAFNDYGTDAFVAFEDIAVPTSKLPEAVREIQALGQKYNVKMVIGGHIGDGNLHPTVWARRSDKDEMERIMRFFEDVGKLAIRLNGTVSAEHGIGVQKKGLLREAISSRNDGNSDYVINLMKNIKRVFDPYGVFNPGKIFD